ncbi:MAG: hypothetical protein P4L40_01075 [Terracidiphilus sp.]|nr:hypothetical protein [Terracidiphilus sp.]
MAEGTGQPATHRPVAGAGHADASEGAANAAPSLLERAAYYRAVGYSAAEAMRAARLDHEGIG